MKKLIVLSVCLCAAQTAFAAKQLICMGQEDGGPAVRVSLSVESNDLISLIAIAVKGNNYVITCPVVDNAAADLYKPQSAFRKTLNRFSLPQSTDPASGQRCNYTLYIPKNVTELSSEFKSLITDNAVFDSAPKSILLFCRWADGRD